MEKCIITAAICGAEVTRNDNPNIPLTADELAAAAKDAEDAGAAIIHLHVRDEKGNPSQKLCYFRAAFEAMNQAGVTAIIQPSTGGAVGMSWEERMHPLELDPEMATLDCGTLNFGDDVFINDLPQMRRFALQMKKQNILPELECFEPGHILNAIKVTEEGLLQEHRHFNIVLGVPGAMGATIKNLLFMTELLPADATWTAAGIGKFQLTIALHSLLMGGHVRVGLEDGIYYTKGVSAESNAQMVERIVRLAGEVGREIAGPNEARDILKISKGVRSEERQ